MILKDILYLVLTYRYAIIVPLALVEGHVISLLVGFLSRTHVFNPFLGALCVMSGNVTGDAILYWLGYHKGEKFVTRWGKYLGITEIKVVRVRKLFEHHSNKILLGSKVTNGFGLASVVLFTAGTMKVPFKRYLLLNALGEFVWTSILVCIGYFLGNIYVTVNNVFEKISIIAIVVATIVLLFMYVKNRLAKRISF